jgi:hypothetical protein
MLVDTQLDGIERLGAQSALDAIERTVERLARALGRAFARAERGAQLFGVGCRQWRRPASAWGAAPEALT